MRIMVFGATGMLGYEVYRIGSNRGLDVHGIVRDRTPVANRLGRETDNRLHEIADAKDIRAVEQIISDVRPDYLINCIGIVKQSHLAENHYESIAVNSFLPHQLERLCEKYHCKLLHISTDCVFDGARGYYNESDNPNACDLYGKSKHLGEVGYGHGLTLRTSIIGHELSPVTHGLLEWFLHQKTNVKGFTKAIFSGLTTLELTNVMLDVVIPRNLPAGVYHLSAAPISKYDLLRIIREVYNTKVEIDPSEDLLIDRSLNGSHFASLTGYRVPDWNDLIREMYKDFNNGF